MVTTVRCKVRAIIAHESPVFHVRVIDEGVKGSNSYVLPSLSRGFPASLRAAVGLAIEGPRRGVDDRRRGPSRADRGDRDVDGSG
jgi:hypothetical protein